MLWIQHGLDGLSAAVGPDRALFDERMYKCGRNDDVMHLSGKRILAQEG